MAVANETKTSSPTQTQEETTQLRADPDRQEIERSQRRELAGRGTAPPYFPSAAEFFGNPFAAVRRMHEEMDRMFAEALGSGTGTAINRKDGGDAGRLAEWSPAVEIKQQGGNLKICAELPGLKPEEVKVELNGNTLVIKGERRQEHTAEEGRLHRPERQYGRFYRVIALPEEAKTAQAAAEFHDGVLEVTVPVSERESQRREIPISSGTGASNGGGAENESTSASNFPKKRP